MSRVAGWRASNADQSVHRLSCQSAHVLDEVFDVMLSTQCSVYAESVDFGKDMNKLAALLLVVVLGFLTWWFALRAPSSAPERMISATSDATQTTVTDASAQSSIIPTTTLTAGHASSESVSANAPSVMEAFHAADDLLLFVETWGVSARHDPEVALAVGLAMKECAVLGVTGDGSRFKALFRKAIQAYPDSAPNIEAAITRTIARCDNLVRVRKLNDLSAGAAWLDIAAAGGNAQAQAMRLENLLKEEGVIETRERMMRLLDPKTPEALVAMSDFAVLNAAALFPPGSLLNQIQGNQWSLILAACELGYNCSASSHYLQSACLGHVPCNFSSVQDLIRTVFLSPLQYEWQRQLAARIAEEIRSGRAAGLFDP
jgi:hypothetical protein